jgi:ATP-dependent Zn protease
MIQRNKMTKKKVILFLLLSLCAAVSCQTLTTEQQSQGTHAQYKDASGNQWSQYNPQPSTVNQAASHQPHHEKYEHHYVGPKQGLVGAPFYGVFPIIFLIGLAAIIIIPLLFFTFSPYGFAGGFGQGAYGRKRSFDSFDVNTFKRGMLDLVTTVSDSIEKYGAMATVFDTLKKKP